jgi:hypothetical protein
LLLHLFKLPLALYRLRLGWLLGRRFMQLTHVGWRSGKVRRHSGPTRDPRPITLALRSATPTVATAPELSAT